MYLYIYILQERKEAEHSTQKSVWHDAHQRSANRLLWLVFSSPTFPPFFLNFSPSLLYMFAVLRTAFCVWGLHMYIYVHICVNIYVYKHVYVCVCIQISDLDKMYILHLRALSMNYRAL